MKIRRVGLKSDAETILDKIYPDKSHFTPPPFHNVVNLEKHLDFGHFYKLQLLQQHCKKGKRGFRTCLVIIVQDCSASDNHHSLIPDPTARSAVPGVTRGEGTNSARPFTPGERNALAKSKVHEISQAHGVWVVINGGHLTDLKIWLFGRSEESPTLKKAWEIVSHNKL